jgi:integrase/recombinase XerC
MSNYVDTVRRPPKTLTVGEQEALLRTTGEHRKGFRDHVIFSVGLGTALREHEIAALDVGDVSSDGERARTRFPLRVFKRSNTNVDDQEAIIPDACRYKLEKFLRWKKASGESLELDAPLFVSRIGRRLSTRMMREAFAEWQIRAGFERHLSFHAIRHTALTNLYRKTKNIRLVQRVARHASIQSTQIYAHVSDEDVLQAVREQVC